MILNVTLRTRKVMIKQLKRNRTRKTSYQATVAFGFYVFGFVTVFCSVIWNKVWNVLSSLLPETDKPENLSLLFTSSNGSSLFCYGQCRIQLREGTFFLGGGGLGPQRGGSSVKVITKRGGPYLRWAIQGRVTHLFRNFLMRIFVMLLSIFLTD